MTTLLRHPEGIEKSAQTPKPDKDIFERFGVKKEDARRKETSYVASTNEVREMTKAIQKERWPGLWYEVLQGAMDYNDYEKGPPRILLYSIDNDEPLSLAEYTAMQKSGDISSEVIKRVEVRNYIKDQGLKPTHIAYTEHVQGEDAQTLGQHGRGLSIASTAVCSGLGENIDYVSKTEELGPWFGQGEMYQDPEDYSAKPCFSLLYARDNNLEVDETIVGINGPSQELLESLEKLTENFLPTNPDYRFARVGVEEGHNYIPNQTTVFSNPGSVTDTTDSFFNRSELMTMGLPLKTVTATEETRVEILPQSFLDSTNTVFVDGLKVADKGKNYAVPWSFWGFREAHWGYWVIRSNDSTSLQGDIDRLIAEAIKRCNDPKTIGRILKANLGDNRSHEGDISYLDFNALSDLTPKAKTAFLEAWQTIKNELGLGNEEPLLTYDRDLAKKTPFINDHGVNKPVLLQNSFCLSSVLIESVPGLKRAEDVIQEQRKLLEEQLIKEREVHIKQLADQERITREKIEAERKARGIAAEASLTDETIKVGCPARLKDALHIAQQHLLHELAFNKAAIVSDDEKGSLKFEMDAKMFDSLPRNATGDLGELASFYKYFVAALGDEIDLEIRIEKNGKGIYFAFDRASKLDNYGNVTIMVKQGEIIPQGKNNVEIILKPKNPGEENALYETFYSSLISNARSIMGPDKRLSYELYKESKFAKDFPPSAARTRMREEAKILIEEQELAIERGNKFLELENARRRALGLPERVISHKSEDEKEIIKQLERAREKLGLSNGQKRETPTDIITEIDESHFVLSLRNPEHTLGLTRIGEIKNSEGTDSEGASRRIESGLKQQARPDFSLFSGLYQRVSGVLISHINPESSSTGQGEYSPMELDQAKQERVVSLVFNKLTPAGTHSLYFPPGYVPSGFYHPKLVEGSITFSKIPNKNMYCFTSEKPIPPGLIFYYKKESTLDLTTPDNFETAPLAKIEDLNPEWQDLVNALREDREAGLLTDKQAEDVLIRAWTKAFTYSNTQETFDKYGYLKNGALAAQIVNLAQGNCGYAGRGFSALNKLTGLPVRELAGYLSPNGNYNQVGNYHMMNQTYINGRWVLIEPQRGYLEEGYKLEPIPDELKSRYNILLRAIPEKEYPSVQETLSLPALPPLNTSRILETTKARYKQIIATSGAAAIALGLSIKIGPKVLTTLGSFIPKPDSTDNSQPAVNILSQIPFAQLTESLSLAIQAHSTEMAVMAGLIGIPTALAISYRRGKRLGRTMAISQLRDELRRIRKKQEELLDN